jgi:hypothetical protein
MPTICGQEAKANPNSSAGLRANILEKMCSGGLYINPDAESKPDYPGAPG